MNKKCVLNENLDCTNCGDCEVCDLDKNKICDNCGKCLGIDGLESKSVMIDKVIDDPEEASKFEAEEDYRDDDASADDKLLDDYNDDYVRKEDDDIPLDIELIDDIDGLGEILDDEERRSKITDEKFPGFFVVKHNK